jgi:hypothetical protein
MVIWIVDKVELGANAFRGSSAWYPSMYRARSIRTFSSNIDVAGEERLIVACSTVGIKSDESRATHSVV